MTGTLPTEFLPLLDAARKTLPHAHAPYSSFHVAAALEDSDGAIHVGCNVECSSFGGTLCAERGALAAGVATGKRHFARLLVLTGADTPTPPCGICRQLLHDFSPELDVCAVNLQGRWERWTLSALLPDAFGGDHF